MSLVRVSTKQVITPKAPSQTVEVQYPKKWFEDHPDSKPTLSLTLVTENMEGARKAIKKGIIDNNIDLDIAKTFLYYYAETIKAKLDSDWVSYDRTIGLDKQEITPLDLV